MEILLIAIAAAAVSAAACFAALGLLRRWTVIDRPNSRSSHSAPTPRGGGLGFVPVILIGWAILSVMQGGRASPVLLAGALAIGLVSFADDLRGVSAGVRLAVQAVAVAAALAAWPQGAIVAEGLPVVLDRLIAGLLWLWFVNLFNFMDGIDGIAASEAGVIAFGIAALALVRPELILPAREAALAGGAAIAFLVVNWPPARIFMGDVGSVVLGYLLGWLLLETAAAGAPTAAVLLPLYFAADATSTLLVRAWRRQPIAKAHREHAYQHAVDRGDGHARTTLGVIALGLVLIVLALLSGTAPVVALVLGLAATAGLILWQRSG